MGAVAAKIIWIPKQIQLPHGKNPWACSLQGRLSFGLHISAGKPVYCTCWNMFIQWVMITLRYYIFSITSAELPFHFFLFDTLEPRRNSTNTAVVSGHVVAKGHEVIEDKSGPTCKEVAMSRRGLQLHFLWFVTGRWLKELGWKGGKNIQSYFGVHHGFWPIDKLVPKAFLGVPRSIWKLFRTLKKRIWSGCVHLTISAEIWSPKLPVFGNSEAP